MSTLPRPSAIKPAISIVPIPGDCSWLLHVWGKQFLIIVDCHIDWPDIIPMGTNTTAYHLITMLHSAFCRTAVPDILWSDRGPQFTAKAFHTFPHSGVSTTKHLHRDTPRAMGSLDSVEWNGVLEWNGNKLDTSDWFSPPYRPPLNKEHLLIKTTQIKWLNSHQVWFVKPPRKDHLLSRPLILIFRVSTEMLGGLSLNNFPWSALRNEHIASLHTTWCLNMLDKLWYS